MEKLLKYQRMSSRSDNIDVFWDKEVGKMEALGTAYKSKVAEFKVSGVILKTVFGV